MPEARHRRRRLIRHRRRRFRRRGVVGVGVVFVPRVSVRKEVWGNDRYKLDALQPPKLSRSIKSEIVSLL